MSKQTYRSYFWTRFLFWVAVFQACFIFGSVQWSEELPYRDLSLGESVYITFWILFITSTFSYIIVQKKTKKK